VRSWLAIYIRAVLAGLRFHISSFFVAAALFVMIDALATNIKPLALIDPAIADLGCNDYSALKLPEILKSPSNPDVLLLGSSLVLVPAVRCDEKLAKIPSRYDAGYYLKNIDTYDKANYFQRLLSERTGHNYSVLNAGVAAGMISDQYLIAKAYLAAGKRPKLAILCVAPRDFHDNCFAPELDKTSTAKTLNTNAACELFRNRQAYQRAVNNYYLRVAGPWIGTDVSHLNKVDEPDYEERPNTLKDLNGYKMMYSPVQQKNLNVQGECFNKLLALFRDAHVPLALVEMPLTSENRAIVNPEIATTYSQAVELAKSKYHLKDLQVEQTTPFQLNDFEDSAHMNARGGTKFFNVLANYVSTAL
jgi:hypothetical protein